jgi:lipopolysaccharide export system protein LptA
MVYLERSETLSFDEKRLPDAQILRGNVRFRHDSALMFCDSAYFFQKDNSLHAFGHVHLVQGDSLEGFGDVLYYNGNTKIARFRRNVRLIHKGTELTTDSLNYNRAKDIAYYFSGGTIKDRLNTLTSVWGQYVPSKDQAIFRDEVQLVHPKFTLNTDTLEYNTATYQADLVCPTRILYEEETTILSSNGWYNTRTEHSMLLDRSQIIHADGMTLTGDTIYYDKQSGYGNVRGHMESVDSTHHTTLYGNRGEIWEGDNHGYATDSAMLVDWSDSIYTYMHADTLFTTQIPYRIHSLVAKDSVLQDSVWVLPPPDTLWIDTSYIRIKAYYNVRLYREDIQLVCDSMHYVGKDSVATLCGNPVCWNDNNQLSSDTVYIYFKNNKPDHIHGVGNATAIKQQEHKIFNQLAGKQMYAYIVDGDLHMVDVHGNAETVFYPQEDDGKYLGINKTQSSFVKMFFKDRMIQRVLFTTSTSGVLIPMSQALEEEKFLVTFFWAEGERPQGPGDIFLRPTRTPRPDAQAISAAAAVDEEEEELANQKNAKKRNNNSSK